MNVKNLILVLLTIALMSPFALGRPGGGPPGGGHIGGARPGGARPSAPVARPSTPPSRPSAPAGGAQRYTAPAANPRMSSPSPNMGRQNPVPSRTNTGMPAGAGTAPRQAGNPSMNQPAGVSRQAGNPSMNQPAGGPRQSGNPSMNQPAGGSRQAGNPSMNQSAGGPQHSQVVPSGGRPSWQNMPHEQTSQIHNNMAHAWGGAGTQPPLGNSSSGAGAPPPPGGQSGGAGTPPPPGGQPGGAGAPPPPGGQPGGAGAPPPPGGQPGGPGAPPPPGGHHPPAPLPPPPRPYWARWGLAVAFTWNAIAITRGCFTVAWWNHMAYYGPWWNYYYYREYYPVYYWWGCPTWVSVCAFYPSYGWTTAYCYDYGETIVIKDNYVYINNEKVATQEEYAKSAAELATYNMPAEKPTEEEKKNIEWLPLGTFALSASPDKPEESTKAAIQLAATKDGLISGSFYHRDSNKTFPIQGRIDKESQRVAFYVIGAEKTVFETGIYNLTQKEAPAMVHLNGGKESKTCLLVRLNPPKEDENGNIIQSDGSDPKAVIDNILSDTNTQATDPVLDNATPENTAVLANPVLEEATPENTATPEDNAVLEKAGQSILEQPASK